eukprot:3788-Heterococcus_DN1.PRE.5
MERQLSQSAAHFQSKAAAIVISTAQHQHSVRQANVCANKQRHSQVSITTLSIHQRKAQYGSWGLH